MPWCDGCDRFWNPNSVPEDGRCPVCGREIAAPAPIHRRAAGGAAATATDVQEPEARAPWHFKLLLVAMTGYLGWRAVQGVEWVLHQL